VSELSSAQEKILARLEIAPTSAFEMSRDLGIAPSIMQEELTDLAMYGLVHREANTIGGEVNIDWRWQLVSQPHRRMQQ
jgi:predicted ArsR family transcriptional regulator